MEVFQHSSQPITVIQQRSPVVRGQYATYGDNLARFFTAARVANILVLASANASQRSDRLIGAHGESFYVASEQSTLSAVASRSNWHLLAQDETEMPALSPGGQVLKLFAALQRAQLDTVVVIRFCAEGDNIPDAVETVVAVNDALNLLPPAQDFIEARRRWRAPKSWRFITGPPVDQAMFM
eukprot:TRINITY_DN2726_c0_g1_i1.p2 TRINITY_DN2726_c0_g1~~TRINITY_DN2726_c0_g1_i1.p2  ORF type:complete len:182 (+),score=43.90 TRINITY_DN2726_c0_g1_i1:298-843(+)